MTISTLKARQQTGFLKLEAELNISFCGKTRNISISLQQVSSTTAAMATWSGVRLGSPPAKRNSFSFGANQTSQQQQQQQYQKQLSFELYSTTPAITITPVCFMSAVCFVFEEANIK